MYTYTLFSRQYDRGFSKIIGDVNPVPSHIHNNKPKECETPEALAMAYFIRGYTYIKKVDKLATIPEQRLGKGFTDIPLDEITLDEFESQFLDLMEGKRNTSKPEKRKKEGSEYSTSHSSLRFQEGASYFQE